MVELVEKEYVVIGKGENWLRKMCKNLKMWEGVWKRLTKVDGCAKQLEMSDKACGGSEACLDVQ